MRFYRLLLFAFPAAVRREFGDDMTALFAMQVTEAKRRRRSVARLWLLAIADAIANGLAARGSGGQAPRPWTWRRLIAAFVTDARYALRMLARQPGVTFVAVATLALGIGANTAIFSAVNAVLLRPLPYADPDQLVTVWEKRQAEGVLDNVVAPADFLDWARLNTTFEAMAAMTSASADLTGSGEPERLNAGVVSPAFFDILRVQPMLGRTFTRDEAIVGKPRVVVLTHKLWVTRFGSDPSVVGRKITLNGGPIEVGGVLPASFEFPGEPIDVWAPLQLEGTAQPLSRASHQFFVYARTKPGVTLQQARTDMERVGTLLSQQYPDTNRTHGAWVVPLEDRLKGPVRNSLLLLLGAVAFVLLIACVNVANILLARAAGRRREMAVRSAVGAGRARLAGQMLTESLVLAALGGACGLLVANWSIQALKEMVPDGLPVVGLSHLRLEPRVLAFTMVLSLATGILFGMLPAWQLARQDPNGVLKEGGRSPGGVRRRLRVALVVSEIALASLLLVAAGLTLRSFLKVLNQPAGFRTSGAATINITLPGARYRGNQAVYTTQETLRERFGAVPGARGAGATSHLPLSGRDGRRGVTIEGFVPTSEAPTRAHPRVITPGYFDAMGITLVAGRAFTAADREGSPPVAIVNETMAHRYWPDSSPIGRRVRFNGDGAVWMEVVGVIADVKHWGLESPVNPEIYQPIGQPLAFSSTMTFVVPAAGDAASLAPALREVVRAVDPNLPVSTIRTMDDVAAVSVATRRTGVQLVGVFGLLALVLAAAGIHGVMSHLVALRTGEIGVRMTLGAAPQSVLSLFLREGALQAIAGLTIGLAGGVLLMRTFRSILYGVEPADPLTLAAVGTVLLATALAACALPARRAMRVDPVTALRS